MKVHKSIRVSAQDSMSNWKTVEVSVELSSADIGFDETKHSFKNLRNLLTVLNYEADVFLCKSLKDPAFEDQIKEKMQQLISKKDEINGIKAELGIG